LAPRLDVLWSVDCETEDTFLYAAITNISEMGIFVQTEEPLAVGTSIKLRFAPGAQDGERAEDGEPGRGSPNPSEFEGDGPRPLGARGRWEPFVLGGVVQWVNRVRPLRACLNPGMGVRFAALTPDDRERIVEVIHTIAYLREDPLPSEPPTN